jgi:hypothetical protein
VTHKPTFGCKLSSVAEQENAMTVLNVRLDERYRAPARREQSAQSMSVTIVERQFRGHAEDAAESRDWWRTKFADGDYVTTFVV